MKNFTPSKTASLIIKVETNNQRLAEMLRLGFEDSAQAVINPGVVMQYITFDEQAQAELETSNRTARMLPYLLQEEREDVGVPTVLPAPANVDSAIAELEAEPDPATGQVDLRKTCPECGAPFEGNGKFCSKKCWTKDWRRHRNGRLLQLRETRNNEKHPFGQRKIILSTITNL